MKIFYKTVLILLIFTFSQFLSAQEEIQYTQYMYTPSLLNPAFVGMREEMNISIIHRSQWVGVNGAPISQSLVFDTPINDNVGFGLNVLHDKIGPYTEALFPAIRLDLLCGILAFGVRVGFCLGTCSCVM